MAFRLLPRLASLLPLLLALMFASCDQTPARNPPSLWLSYSQLEINLVLVDFEPPPF